MYNLLNTSKVRSRRAVVCVLYFNLLKSIKLTSAYHNVKKQNLNTQMKL